MRAGMIWKNIAGNKAASLITMLFIMAASLLLSLSAGLIVNLSGAIDRLMQRAETPHFMQMHTGELSGKELETFAAENGNVEAFQILKFLNIENSRILIGENTLSGSLQDNGFCTQSGQFDYLLDLENVRIRPRDGELYVPVCYFRDGTAKEGDKAVVGGRTFRVAGFIRDSQMNAMLASSKRFVVSESDFQALVPEGGMEYLIEFRLRDVNGLRAFETAYSEAGLPANGPTLTWPLFRMMSAISDGMMIAVILLISILVILIALLCVRFTLLAQIEDDIREIGVMKAIGIPLKDIRGIYLSVYAALAAGGSAAGFFTALFLQKPLQAGIRMNLGDGGSRIPTEMVGAAGAAFVFFMILLYVNYNLRRFRKMSAVQAIRSGTVQEGRQRRGKSRMTEGRLLSVNFFLGMREVMSGKRLYATMLAVVVLACFILIVPQNLYHTISDEAFITYMGVGECDLRLDIQQTDKIASKTEEIAACMENDPDIASYSVFHTRMYGMKREDGSKENIRIELGDHSVFPLQYVSGRFPASDTEIALSAINAEELGKKVGDRISIDTGKGEMYLTVCGIYSDITNGGKTAKAVFKDTAAETMQGIVCAGLKDAKQAKRKAADYEAQFAYAKVSEIGEYVSQTFGQTLKAVRTAALTAVFAAVIVTMLVTLLFMKLLTAKDSHTIAVQKALGFTGTDIRRQYLWRAVLIMAAGIALGTALAETFGEKLVSIAMKSFGAADFHFKTDPLNTWLLVPALLFMTALLATFLGTGRTQKADYSSLCE